jgi:sRNA-binding regulator protein Hfq
VGTGAIGPAQRGFAVALSADGNTALVGGSRDNGFTGATWVFTRSNGVWSQQGGKLVGTGVAGINTSQGISVALSADGNTALIGGHQDNTDVGAAWVFTRSGSVWTQQGGKLVGTGRVGESQQGISVALSADGNTAMVGGNRDNSFIGAAWVFTRSNGVWTQQGSKLVGTGGAAGTTSQGRSVALSGDGNTAFVGGFSDNSNRGATWVFTRSGNAWSQQGSKLVGTGFVGASSQGFSAALSDDGLTGLVGGFTDNTETGAAWPFVRRPATATHDFNGDGRSDILWRGNDGSVATWLMNGSRIAGATSLGVVAPNFQIVGQRDFDGDGEHDLLWRDISSGRTFIWLMNCGQATQSGHIGTVDTAWQVAGTADFNGDGRGDILWRNSSGAVVIWLMNGLQVASSAPLGTIGLEWTIVGTGDFNGDGMADILWRNNEGTVAIWLMNGLQVLDSGKVAEVDSKWGIVGTGDFNGDGNFDILWRHQDGTVAMWLLNGFQAVGLGVGSIPNNWTVVETGDFNGNGKSDILWRESPSGTVAIWFMNGPQITSGVAIGAVANTWTIQETNAD